MMMIHIITNHSYFAILFIFPSFCSYRMWVCVCVELCVFVYVTLHRYVYFSSFFFCLSFTYEMCICNGHSTKRIKNVVKMIMLLLPVRRIVSIINVKKQQQQKMKGIESVFFVCHTYEKLPPPHGARSSSS